MSDLLWEHKHQPMRYGDGETSLDEVLLLLSRQFPAGFSPLEADAWVRSRYGSNQFTLAGNEALLPEELLGNGFVQQGLKNQYQINTAMLGSWLGPLRVRAEGRETQVAAGIQHLATYGHHLRTMVHYDAEQGSDGQLAAWRTLELMNPFTYRLRSRIWVFRLGEERPRIFSEETIMGDHLRMPPYPEIGAPYAAGNTVMVRDAR